MRLSATVIGLSVLALTSPALAEDVAFASPGCEFQMTYPEKPMAQQQCQPNAAKLCHQATIYNRSFDGVTGIRINTTCNDAEPGMLDKYDDKVMRYTLEMVAKDHVDHYQTGVTNYPDARQGVLLGSHTAADGSETVFMEQIWIGRKSVFTVQGEVGGNGDATEANAVFSKIMKSVRPVAGEQKPSAKQPDENGDEASDDQAGDKQTATDSKAVTQESQGGEPAKPASGKK